MTHDLQFDENDHVLGHLRSICLALPGTDEKVSHGRPAFFTKKIFAIYGAIIKGSSSPRHDQSLVFLPDAEERPALEQHESVFLPAYWGPYGWLGYDLSGSPDWDEVAELVEESYRQTASRTLIKTLDAQRAD